MIFWLLFIVFEIYWNRRLIRGGGVNHNQRTFIRCSVGAALWLGAFFFVQLDRWLALPLALGFSFWFLFDVGLNIVRDKKITYLGTGKNASKLDLMQASAPIVWLWFKFLLAAASITLYYYGLNRVVTYSEI